MALHCHHALQFHHCTALPSRHSTAITALHCHHGTALPSLHCTAITAQHCHHGTALPSHDTSMLRTYLKRSDIQCHGLTAGKVAEDCISDIQCQGLTSGKVAADCRHSVPWTDCMVRLATGKTNGGKSACTMQTNEHLLSC